MARQKHTLTQTGVLNRIFKRLVPVSIKKEASGTFSFTCPVTALPVSYRRRLTLCTALSTWSPRFTRHDLYQRRSLASRAKRSFYFGPPKINGSNSKVSLLWLHNLEKNEKELWRYKHHCFILSSSLISFNGLFAPYERMYLLSINIKVGGTQNKTHVPSRVLLYTYS